MKVWLVGIMLLLASAAWAADETEQRVTTAEGSVLRALDMMTGRLVDIEFANGETKVFERLEITVSECRYPVDNPSSDAFAHITIREPAVDKTWFDGWMTAASPALSAMDHARYDVWVLRCKIPEAVTPDEG
jgi:hypothetical protein